MRGAHGWINQKAAKYWYEAVWFVSSATASGYLVSLYFTGTVFGAKWWDAFTGLGTVGASLVAVFTIVTSINKNNREIDNSARLVLKKFHDELHSCQCVLGEYNKEKMDNYKYKRKEYEKLVGGVGYLKKIILKDADESALLICSPSIGSDFLKAKDIAEKIFDFVNPKIQTENKEGRSSPVTQGINSKDLSILTNQVAELEVLVGNILKFYSSLNNRFKANN